MDNSIWVIQSLFKKMWSKRQSWGELLTDLLPTLIRTLCRHQEHAIHIKTPSLWNFDVVLHAQKYITVYLSQNVLPPAVRPEIMGSTSLLVPSASVTEASPVFLLSASPQLLSMAGDHTLVTTRVLSSRVAMTQWDRKDRKSQARMAVSTILTSTCQETRT